LVIYPLIYKLSPNYFTIEELVLLWFKKAYLAKTR
jgi:hypothetical protein